MLVVHVVNMANVDVVDNVVIVCCCQCGDCCQCDCCRCDDCMLLTEVNII